MVDCGKPPSQVIRLLVRRRDCDAKADAFCCCSHCTDYSQWLVDWPLRTRYLCRVKRSVVHIIATEDICYEDTMEFGIFKHFRKFYPMVDIIEFVRAIIRVSPKPWRLMTTAYTSNVSYNNSPGADSQGVHVIW